MSFFLHIGIFAEQLCTKLFLLLDISACDSFRQIQLVLFYAVLVDSGNAFISVGGCFKLRILVFPPLLLKLLDFLAVFVNASLSVTLSFIVGSFLHLVVIGDDVCRVLLDSVSVSYFVSLVYPLFGKGNDILPICNGGIKTKFLDFVVKLPPLFLNVLYVVRSIAFALFTKLLCFVMGFGFELFILGNYFIVGRSLALQ